MEDGEVERPVVEDGEVAILESEVDKFENIFRVSGKFVGVAGVEVSIHGGVCRFEVLGRP